MKRTVNARFSLFFYDFLIFLGTNLLLFVVYQGGVNLDTTDLLHQSILAFCCVFGARFIGNIYRQIWRYGGIQCYIRMLSFDALGFFAYVALERALPMTKVMFVQMLAFCCMNTLASLAIRMFYRFAYKCGSKDSRTGAFLRVLIRVFAGNRVHMEPDPDSQKIKIAIIGAGNVGIGLAEDLLGNPKSQYIPRCFVDSSRDKVGRTTHGLKVFSEDEATIDEMKKHHIQEVVFAVPSMDNARKLELFEYYHAAGFRIKVYDYPTMDIPSKKRKLREFEISDLLFRAEKDVINDRTRAYYQNKVILITGGGGSIGSELCRQLAKMGPKQLIILDICENTSYELMQDLKFVYKDQLDVRVEITSIRDKKGLARVFREYHPDICINAAAHKHVPLMEKNCVEAVENNVFGTMNVIQCCEEYGCGRFLMVSTDKAVNPTNVMGATKRMCEMVMQAYSSRGKVHCSATRFGNVLGSAGSVIPLFKKQIAAGGPITITDKRIIRYFMTIPEASQLVLTSGAMAENGQLFVLDMGKPVKIFDLAMNMISISGMNDIEIIETGLRPGEKLYEELLVKSDTLEKTDNDMIFVEKEAPVTMDELTEKLGILRAAIETDTDDNVREALRKAVPTFRRPEEVNREALDEKGEAVKAIFA